MTIVNVWRRTVSSADGKDVMIPPGDAGAAASAPFHREAIALAWERVAIEAGCTEREAAHWALLALETLSYPADVHEYREGIIQHNDEQARFREGIKRAIQTSFASRPHSGGQLDATAAS
jgi:hypothetical protein